jgi:peptidoglycan/xylan/chitin deacetylase (PgdA/CDA1 family)
MSLLAVMYHYVRDLARSCYPRIRGRDRADFIGQLDYLARHHTFVSMDDVLGALDGNALPPAAVLLTFDDGLRDHFDVVFPILRERGISAAFYPPSKPVLERVVLDVHKLHFVLASCDDETRVHRSLFAQVAKMREEHGLESDAAYLARCESRPSRWDTTTVVTIKRMLQVELPSDVRARIVGQLFDEFVGIAEKTFADELYVTASELGQLARAGMHVGSHGYAHVWLDALSTAEQTDEITRSLAVLDAAGIGRDRWTISYPYGGFNDSLIDVVGRLGARAGITVRAGLSSVAPRDRFLLSRLDTNDIPCKGDAPLSSWTTKQMEVAA